MFVPLVYAATVTLLSLRSFASASPLIVGREGQGVWNPHITAPSEGDVWTVGSTQLVTWDTDDIPHYAKDNIGTLLLGYFDGSTQEHLDTRESGAVFLFLILLFDCRRQSIPLQRVSLLPTVTCIFKSPMSSPAIRTSSFVCAYTLFRGKLLTVRAVMGNSGNASPEFRITRHSRPGMSSESFDKASPQKGSDDPDSKPAPSNFVPVSPGSLSPDQLLSDARKSDSIETEQASTDTQPSAYCKERHSGSKTGNTWSSTHDSTSGEGRSRHC